MPKFGRRLTTVVLSLLWAEAQPTLNLSAETM